MIQGFQIILLALGWLTLPSHATMDEIVVGSKTFTENYILAETAAQVLEHASTTPVRRRLGMGSTGILFESLKIGAIDIYPDYTGTLAESIVKKPHLKSIDAIREALSPLGLTISDSLGFNNTYALAVKKDFAQLHNLHSLSDLRKIKTPVRAAFGYEFMGRIDGYRGMVEKYQFHFNPQNIKRMEHSLVYQAINQNAVNVIEVYSTDANIKRFDLRLLVDDKNYFPKYNAVWVARKSFVKKHPKLWQNLLKYENSINETLMIDLNAQAEIEKKSFKVVAANFLGEERTPNDGRMNQLVARTKEHLWLVGISLLFSIFVGVPLGIVAARFHAAGQGILLFSALVQTIPSLALLCFLIPVFGIGTKPALVALCLYSLLPVVLNTFTGIRAIDPRHLENAQAFGLTKSQILRKVILPMASPTILAGIKTAAIVTIGTATLAALIGAGGYGALIVSGLALNDIPLILYGAVPAALMALIAHVAFMITEALVISPGLKNK
jgi:osmoprotectant transport system permease protein